MARAIGVTDFLNKKFITFDFDGEWLSSFGEPEKNFSACIYGKSGNGKTEFCVMLAKYLTKFGRVYYNSFEQGYAKSLQDALRRQNMDEVAGNIIFGDRESFEEMKVRLKRKKSPQIVFIDSRDFMNLTHEQFKELRVTFRSKVFIIICHAEGQNPRGQDGKQIEYYVDIKIRVSHFVAYPRSRFGGNQPFIIWPERAILTNQPSNNQPSTQLTFL